MGHITGRVRRSRDDRASGIGQTVDKAFPCTARPDIAAIQQNFATGLHGRTDLAQLSLILGHIPRMQGGIAQQQQAAVAVGNDADRSDVVHAFQGIGDLLHAIVIGIEDHHFHISHCGGHDRLIIRHPGIDE